jgi:hypothetical protein
MSMPWSVLSVWPRWKRKLAPSRRRQRKRSISGLSDFAADINALPHGVAKDGVVVPELVRQRVEVNTARNRIVDRLQGRMSALGDVRRSGGYIMRLSEHEP